MGLGIMGIYSTRIQFIDMRYVLHAVVTQKKKSQLCLQHRKTGWRQLQIQKYYH